jgi:Flp pilus assembly protein TadG
MRNPRRQGPSLRSFAGDRGGNIAVMGALLMLPLTLLAGGASDYARARQIQSALQDALDAAVIGGVTAAAPAPRAAALFDPPVQAGVSVSAPNLEVRTGGLLWGEVTAQVPAAFLSLAGIQNFNVRVQSAASVRRVPTDVCLTAVHTAGPGLRRQGSGDILATGCRFDIRSTASPAASFGSNGGRVAASDICVRGASVVGSAPATLRTGCTIEGPARLTPPVPSIINPCSNSADDAVHSDGPYELPPGTYCGNIRLTGAGAFTLRANGVYVLRALPGRSPGQIIYDGTGSLRGDGVFIYFADSTQLVLGDQGQSGRVFLTAPASGPHQGVLMSEAPGLTASPMSFKRSSGAFMRGVIHLPSRHVSVGGSGSAVMDEVTMVVNSIATDGSGAYTFKPAPLSVAHSGEAVLAR